MGIVSPAQPTRPDAVERQLKRLASQGGHTARLAHLCAFLLIVLFSAGSLVSLSGEALTSILSQWHARGALDVPAAISVAVSTLLVLAMDVSMIYAASVLRMLTARHAYDSEKRTHQLVMAGVAILEAATYAYMSALYDHPASLATWALILARAGAAPFLAVYLSMARPLPVERRDILAAAALASGAGVLRDVTTLANDASAPLARKVALYKAADHAPGRDDEQLDRMMAVLAGPTTPSADSATPTPHIAPQDAPQSVQAAPVSDIPLALDDPTPPTLPTGPGAPTQVRRVRRQPAAPILRLEPASKAERSERKVASAKAAGGLPPSGYRDQAIKAWGEGARSIRKMMAATDMSRTAAQAWVRTLKEGANTAAPSTLDQQVAQ